MEDYTTMPSEGQFIAIWEYDGIFWAGNYKWVDGVLCQSSNGDEFEEELGFPYRGQKNIHYLRSGIE